MANDLAVVNVKEQRPVQILEFSSAQTKLLADTIAKGCDENELRLFLEIAKLKRLDPFSGQIRPVKRWDSEAKAYKMVIQTGIDGYRSTASRTDEMAGIDDAIFNSEDDDHPKWAKVTVYRWSHNEKIPYTATARWSEYVQKKQGGEPNSMWTRMPYLMLAKCAEALALRKAFPDELAGVYTDEEMGQADNIIEGQAEPPQLKAPVNMPQATKIEGKLLTNGVIEARKDGKEDTLWLSMGKHIVAISADKAGLHPYSIGDFMEFTAIERAGKERNFLVLEEVHSYKSAPAANTEEDTIPPIPDGTAPAKPMDEMDKAIAEGKFDENPTGTLEETRTGKIGNKRRTVLYALMNAHKEKTGLTNDLVHKILEKLPVPVGHLADLELNMFEDFKKIMKGEIDWRPFLEDQIGA